MKCQVHESRLISINEDEGKSTKVGVSEVDQINRGQSRSNQAFGSQPNSGQFGGELGHAPTKQVCYVQRSRELLWSYTTVSATVALQIATVFETVFLTSWTIMYGAHVRPGANPPPHSQVALRAADKSRKRDFLFLAHELNAVSVLFPQLPYLVAWGQYCRLSLLSMPCASPLKNGLHRNSLISRAENH